MRLDQPDYIKLVIGAYNKKRTNGKLSPLLIQSTPANIRRECANVYQERNEKKDEQTLRAFFGPAEQGRKLLSVIQKFDVDRFRPLDSYLKEPEKKGINDRNLELLAWLIDFRHRPFVFGMDVILDDEELALITNDLGDTQPVPEPKGPDEKPVKPPSPVNPFIETDKQRSKFRKSIVFFLVLIICTGGIYAVWQQKRDKQITGNTNADCMYWAGDHYDKVPCNEKRKGLVLPLDLEMIKHFRKITREDTITEQSIGVIYYLKTDRKIEYFTTGGKHPVYVTRTLKVLSPYMFQTYLRKKEAPKKDSFAEKNKSTITNR